MFAPQTEWVPPTEFPNLSKYDEIAIDLETKDPDLMKMGSGSVTGNGNMLVLLLLYMTGLVTIQLLTKVVVTWTRKKF